MRVLVINSSPRKEGESKTALMLKHLIKGMQEVKTEVEVANLRQKK
jgi:multimeric flavodoxin WrbA